MFILLTRQDVPPGTNPRSIAFSAKSLEELSRLSHAYNLTEQEENKLAASIRKLKGKARRKADQKRAKLALITMILSRI